MKKIILILILQFICVSCTLASETWNLVAVISQGETTEIADEIVPVRYCTSRAEVKSVTCSAGTSNDLTFGTSVQGGGAIGAVLAEGRFSVGANVASSIGFNQSGGETLDLDPPPDSGYIYHYPIKKTYHIYIGQMLANSSRGNEQILPFTFKARCSLELGEPEVSTCDGTPVEPNLARSNEPSLPPENTPTRSLTNTPVPPPAYTPTPQPTNTSISQASSECDLIAQSFPQTKELIRDHFGLPSNERIFKLVDKEGCGSIVTGFIFEGDTLFELAVPEGGCIDSYEEAYYSDPTVPESFGGLRAYSGIVRTTGVTYRVYGCELKP